MEKVYEIWNHIRNMPAEYRRAIYVSPLFLPWVFGETFEKGETEKTAARRGMVLFLLFFLVVIGLFVLSEAVKRAVGLPFVLQMMLFVTHTLAILFYLLYSVLLMIQEMRGKPIWLPVPAVMIDKLANTVFRFFSA